MNEVSDYAGSVLDTRLLVDRSAQNWTTVDFEYDDEGVVGVGDRGETVERKARAYDVLTEWHTLHHVGRFAWCTEQPCHAVNGAVTAEGTRGLELLG
ncbi:hypothetical protein [Microlunatus sp. GCM10028923]|uniref:hypothetical protein n=1 Tax=Microlunatus sp. GCM10028923 TaxID=3273400 RepID=UPI00361B9E65